MCTQAEQTKIAFYRGVERKSQPGLRRGGCGLSRNMRGKTNTINNNNNNNNNETNNNSNNSCEANTTVKSNSAIDTSILRLLNARLY